MEELSEDSSYSHPLAGISDSSKFKLLCKTIYSLRAKYLARGVKHDQITQKIMCKIFNTKHPLNVNWLNLKNTLEYHKIKSTVELDPKTIELALAIKQEIEKMKKKKKHDKQARDDTLDEMLDMFQLRLESNLNLDKNSSSSSSDSLSDLGENFCWSPEHSTLSYYDQTIQNFNFDGINFIREQSNTGKRKSKKQHIDMEDGYSNEAQGEIKKKVKVSVRNSEHFDSHKSKISNFLGNDMYYEPFKRTRENDNEVFGEKTKSLKL